MTAAFLMSVKERLVLPDLPDVIIAGPVITGSCRSGDRLLLLGESANREVVCIGIEHLNWGRDRADWLSVRVSDVDLIDVLDVVKAVSKGTCK